MSGQDKQATTEQIIEAQNEAINELSEKVDALETQLKENTRGNLEAIQAQKDKLKEKRKLTCPDVKIGNKKHTFRLAAFRYRGVKYIAEDILEDQDLLKELVKNAPSVFEEK